MRIAVTGTSGQLVQCLIQAGPAAGAMVLTAGRPVLDLADPASVFPALAALAPDAIVSAAAYTAVDKAESERDAAFAVNASGAAAVAEAALRLGVPLVHISTDYVFDGRKTSPYLETDATSPLSVYGASKLAGERLVAAATPDHVILRTAWVYSPYGANFVKTILRLGAERDSLRVVADQNGCPTSAEDAAAAILSVCRNLVSSPAAELRGVFHLTGSGQATWADLAETVLQRLQLHTGKQVRVERIGAADYPTAAIRPANSRLDGGKLKTVHGITLPAWQLSAVRTADRLLLPR